MHRRNFIASLSALSLAGCGYFRIDKMNVLIRSDIIRSAEQEREILSRAKVEWTPDVQMRVLYVQGTPYEMGYQQGVLLRRHIQDNLGFLYRQALRKFHFDELFSEAFERMDPYIPTAYRDEMHGLAHGARMPLQTIHHIHALPEIGEWGGKRDIVKLVKRMAAGEDFGTSCSNICANKSASADGRMYTVRILDWGLHRVSKLHKYPVLTVAKPQGGIPYVNIGWAGFLGAVSGMNAEGITLGEMGYGDPPGETMRGKPMPFLLRDVLSQARNLADVRRIISESAPTSSYAFLMSDGKSGEAELYIRDPFRFKVFKPGDHLQDGKADFPAIKDITYGGHYADRLQDSLSKSYQKITPQILMKEIIPRVAMKSNFQNVVYDPAGLAFWVANAASKEERAAEQPYTYFDFGKALQNFPKA